MAQAYLKYFEVMTLAEDETKEDALPIINQWEGYWLDQGIDPGRALQAANKLFREQGMRTREPDPPTAEDIQAFYTQVRERLTTIR